MSPRTRLLVAMISTGVISYQAVGSLLGRVLGDNTYGQLAVLTLVLDLRKAAFGEIEQNFLDAVRSCRAEDLSATSPGRLSPRARSAPPAGTRTASRSTPRRASTATSASSTTACC